MKYLVCYDGGAQVVDAPDVFTAECLAHEKRKGRLLHTQEDKLHAIKAGDYRCYLATKNDERMVALSRPVSVGKRQELKGDLPFTSSTRFDGVKAS